MKTLSIIMGVVWAVFAVFYGIGLLEPSQFVYTGMAALLSAEGFSDYFRNR